MGGSVCGCLLWRKTRKQWEGATLPQSEKGCVTHAHSCSVPSNGAQCYGWKRGSILESVGRLPIDDTLP